jgi:NAD(P)H-hydrate repair Nnr-like enzyme with NAD(P)H-hydrate dehydratase domain
MISESWQKQGNEPLFPDMLWSKPENKQHAGKLLIIGGNAHSIEAPAKAYMTALKAGIGTAKVLLPDVLAITVGATIPDVHYAPSNKSGGFSTRALAEWLDSALWADAVLLAGDTARNSETAIVMERFLEKYTGKVIITKDCLDQFLAQPDKIIKRQETLIVASFAQLQKLTGAVLRDPNFILKYSNPLLKNIEILSRISRELPALFCTKQNDQVLVAIDGRVSVTVLDEEIWRTPVASNSAVWWLQNSSKPFEAITTALFESQTKNPS